MATETPAVPTNSPASKQSKASEAFRGGLLQAASEDSKVAKVINARNPAPGAETPKPPVQPAAETPKPEVVKPAVTPPADGKSDPDEGLKAAIKPNDSETNLANLRKKSEAAERRAAEAEARITELEAIRGERDRFKTDRDTLEQALERYNVEASPRFQEKFEKPQKQQLDAIRKTLAVTDANADSFIATVQMPESRERTAKLNEAFATLDDISKGKIATAITQFDQVRDQRAQELSNPTEAFQSVVLDQKQRTEKQRKEHEAVIDDTIGRAQKNIGWFNPIEGNEGWNAQIEDVKTQAKRVWTQLTSPQELSEITLMGVMAPKLKKINEFQQAEIERLNEELAQYRDATPKTNAGGKENGAHVEAAKPLEGRRGTHAAWDAFRSGAGIK